MGTGTGTGAGGFSFGFDVLNVCCCRQAIFGPEFRICDSNSLVQLRAGLHTALNACAIGAVEEVAFGFGAFLGKWKLAGADHVRSMAWHGA